MEKYYLWFRKYWLHFLLVSYVLFILYSTVLPFNFVLDWKIFSSRFSRIDWIPFWGKHREVDRADMVANIIFFIPLGILLGLQKILTNYRNYTAREWLILLGVGFSISSTVEFLQLFTMDRHTSSTDVLANAAGTLLGAGLILVIYLKFHQPIKAILFQLFYQRPEMSISAVLLIFIGLSYSVPFTYELEISSIVDNIRQLGSIRINSSIFLLSLLSSVLMFGTMIYFLLNGMYRYFQQDLSRFQKLLILLLCFSVPVLLELYQLLIPVRHHSVSDIMAAGGGLSAGIAFFFLQKVWLTGSSPPAAADEKNQFRLYLHYFEGLLIVYLAYCLLYFNSQLPTTFAVSSQNVLSTSKPTSDLQSFRLWRIQLLIHFNKEVFTFLPAGFILSFIRSEWKNKGWRISVIFIFLALITYFIYQRFLGDGYFSLSLLALLIGLWLGQAFWKIFKFMMSK
jgi:glycopeptide antibiotics resistance protein